MAFPPPPARAGAVVDGARVVAGALVVSGARVVDSAGSAVVVDSLRGAGAVVVWGAAVLDDDGSEVDGDAAAVAITASVVRCARDELVPSAVVVPGAWFVVGGTSCGAIAAAPGLSLDSEPDPGICWPGPSTGWGPAGVVVPDSPAKARALGGGPVG